MKCNAVGGNDQWIALTVDSDERWAKLAVLMGQPALAQDKRYATAAARREHRVELVRRLVVPLVADAVRVAVEVDDSADGDDFYVVNVEFQRSA